jgi:thiol-disulfide isomerase/thioredoxin
MKSATKKTLLFVAVITALAFLSFYAAYSEGFTSSSDAATKLYMVYADWCPHCKAVKPMMEALKSTIGSEPALKGKSVAVELIDGESGSPMLKELPEVKGYPSFFVKRGDQVTEYKGPREKEAIVEALA